MLRVLYTLVFMTCIMSLTAQSVKFTVEVDRDTLMLGEAVNVIYKIENANGSFQQPDYDDFYLLSGPNTQSSFTMINGEVEQSMSYSYVLAPRMEGKLTLGEAGLEIDGDRFSAPEVHFHVLPNPDGVDFQPPTIEDYPLPERKAPRKESKPKKKHKIVEI